MANKRTIVSTSIGAEGIEFTKNKNILIANTSEEFITSICNLLSNHKILDEIGNSACNFAQENYDFSIIANKVLNFIEN